MPVVNLYKNVYIYIYIYKIVFYVSVGGERWLLVWGREVINRAPEACAADTSSSNFAVIGQQLWVSILIDICRPP